MFSHEVESSIFIAEVINLKLEFWSLHLHIIEIRQQ